MIKSIIRGSRLLAALTLIMIILCPMSAFAGWQKEGDTYAYYEEDGTRVVNQFRKSGGQWFYLDENGQLLKNCEREIDGKLYVFNDRGAVEPNSFRSEKKKGEESSFTAISSRQAKQNEKANPYMDDETVQWINATCAVLTRHNGGNIRAFGGALKLAGTDAKGEEQERATREKNRQLLKKSWNVTDRQSADQVLESLLESAREQHSAWDYSRAMSNLGFYYLADYYEETEALDLALEVAEEIQGEFGSWDEFMEGYLEGYEEWSGDKHIKRFL